jgi:nucleotidyltransferase substrate binding protein (TIGR01987 family)
MNAQIDTTFVARCVATLYKAVTLLQTANPESLEYDLYKSACIKEFEIILEQCGKLLRKALKSYFHSPKAADALTFKDIFRQATLHNLIEVDTCERWLVYRDNRNSVAHDYGINFAQETLILLPQFVIDANELIDIINNQNALNK